MILNILIFSAVMAFMPVESIETGANIYSEYSVRHSFKYTDRHETWNRFIDKKSEYNLNLSSVFVNIYPGGDREGNNFMYYGASINKFADSEKIPEFNSVSIHFGFNMLLIGLAFSHDFLPENWQMPAEFGFGRKRGDDEFHEHFKIGLNRKYLNHRIGVSVDGFDYSMLLDDEKYKTSNRVYSLNYSYIFDR